MKTLKLIFSRLNFYFTSNRLIFIMFLLGGIVCSISLIYFYGNQLSSKQVEVINDTANAIYELTFDEPIFYDEAVNNEVLDSEKINDTTLRYHLSMEQTPEQFLEGIYEDNDPVIYMCAQLENKEQLYCSMGRVTFSEEELENGENVVILPNRESCYDLEQGDSITIDGKTYEIVGMSTFQDYVYIPLKTFEKCGYTIDKIRIDTAVRMNRNENNQFIEELQAAFPEGRLTKSPNRIYESADKKLLGDIILVAFEYMAVLLSFMFLIKFFIDRSNFENVIYLIVGATKRRLFALLMLENILLSSIIGLIAIGIHSAFYDVFFTYANLFEGLEYSLTDYAIILISIIILSSITSIPFVTSCLKNSIIKNKNKYI